MIYVNEHISIDEKDISLSFVQSTGPGGQNINKNATAVQLRFDVKRTTALNEEIRQRLFNLAGRQINRAGELVIEARRFRNQSQNRRDAFERLMNLLHQASHTPIRRRKTIVPSHVHTQRLESKRRRSLLKKTRQSLRDY